MSRALSDEARTTTLEESVPVFAALADGTRLRLVARLCEDGPSSIARLAAGEEITRQAITKHLHVMAEAGLVQVTRQGRESVWALEPRRLEDARRCLDSISTQWDEVLARLKRHVEG
jgi:DNA-binding transcriptional ArsR family regulator